MSKAARIDISIYLKEQYKKGCSQYGKCKTCDADVRWTSERLSSHKRGGMDELGVEKCVSLVTDNAEVMRSAWHIIEAKHPHVFANGCAAHWINLLIKVFLSLKKYAKLMDQVVSLVRFIRNKHCIPTLKNFE